MILSPEWFGLGKVLGLIVFRMLYISFLLVLNRHEYFIGLWMIPNIYAVDGIRTNVCPHLNSHDIVHSKQLLIFITLFLKIHE